MKYVVECMWMTTGFFAVEAESADEARKMVLKKQALPDNGEYLSDSFRVVDVSLEN